MMLRRWRAWISAASLCLCIGTAGAATGGELRFTGVVRHVGVEGGCWKIDAGGTAYEVVNLAPEWQRNGLQVTVRARRFDGGTICMVGLPVEIIDIREAQPPRGVRRQ